MDVVRRKRSFLEKTLAAPVSYMTSSNATVSIEAVEWG
jgi:hypothetical protein